MIRILALLLLPLVAGCGASPSPMMFGAARSDAIRDGRHYVLFRKDDRVEVIRLGHARRGGHQAIRETMVALMGELTGCRIRDGTLQGDSGEMRARIACKA